MATDLDQLFAAPPAGQFRPYCYRNQGADAFTVFFSDSPYTSKRLTDHVTIYVDDSNELVGCRVKGISGLIEDLPNYLEVTHNGSSIAVLFLPFWNPDPNVRRIMKKLAERAKEFNLSLDDCEETCGA